MHGAKHRQQLVQIVRLTLKQFTAAITKSNLRRSVVLIENIRPRFFNLPNKRWRIVLSPNYSVLCSLFSLRSKDTRTA